jgi:hypothetical protein
MASNRDRELARQCRECGIEVDVSDIESLSSWQRQRLTNHLSGNTSSRAVRTVPRVLYQKCDTPDFRLPWIEDIVHDVEDCLRHNGLELSVSLASKIRQRQPQVLDTWVIGFWSMVSEGRNPRPFDVESFPLRGDDDGADPVDQLGLTAVTIPPEIGNVVEIFSLIEQLNGLIKSFLTGLAAISMQPDLRKLDQITNDDSLLASLRKSGVVRVCDLVASVVTGSIHELPGLSKKQRESAVLLAADVQRRCVESIRNAIAKQGLSNVNINPVMENRL